MATKLRTKKEIAADIEQNRQNISPMFPPKRKSVKKKFSSLATVVAMRNTARRIKNTAVSMKNSAVAAKNNVVAAKNKIVETKENIRRKAKATHRAIHANPYPAIGIVLLSGAIIGFFATCRNHKSKI